MPAPILRRPSETFKPTLLHRPSRTILQFSDKIIIVDCRELEPPEPMVKVLEAVNDMAEDEAVLMIHRKVPRLLFSKLDELGFSHELTEETEGLVKLLIWRDLRCIQE